MMSQLSTSRARGFPSSVTQQNHIHAAICLIYPVANIGMRKRKAFGSKNGDWTVPVNRHLSSPVATQLSQKDFKKSRVSLN
jgi:hypothetical protein